MISTRANSLSLVRMALFKVSRATENDTNARVKLLSETLMGHYWMAVDAESLWAVKLQPETYWG